MIPSTATRCRRAQKARSYRTIAGAAVLLAVFVGLLASATSALAAAPWWGLTSESWPTNLHSGLAKDDVQELTVSATSGDFFFGGGTERIETMLPFDATAEEVQKQLESAYPANKVEVSGGPLATGRGTVVGPVSTTGTLTEGSPTVEEVPKGPALEVASGFVVGQAIEGAGIPTGTTILNVEGETLTLSAAIEAGKSGSGVTLTGVASTTVTSVTGFFAIGQELSGKGISAGTEIEAVGAGTLTLSQTPTAAGGAGVRLGVLAPYVITFPSQRAPLVTAKSVNLFGFHLHLECKTLEELGHGSCGADPGRIIGSLEAGTKSEPEVTEKAQGRPDGTIVVTAENLGDAWVDASVSPVVLEDTLPEDLEVVGVEPEVGGSIFERFGAFECATPTPHHVRCVLEGSVEEGRPRAVAPYHSTRLFIAVKTVGTLSSEPNVVNISGGGAKPVTSSEPIRAGASTPYGVAEYKMVAEEEGGGVSAQAGVHPFQLTTTVVLNEGEPAASHFDQEPVGMAKDLTFQLPAGLIGNPAQFPQCTAAQFTAEHEKKNFCPANTALGEVALTINVKGIPLHGILTQMTVPVFNLEPRHGEPARFGFDAYGADVYLDTSIRTGSDYGVTVKVSNISQVASFLASRLTFWGVPGDPAHDSARGWDCFVAESTSSEMTKRCPAGVAKPPPFLSMPTSCSGPMPSTLQADSWEEPHPSSAQLLEAPLFAEFQMGGLGGCNHLQFSPEIRDTPDSAEASKPTGMNVDVHVPQSSVLNAEGLAESNVKDITVALPEGVAVNPAGGGGLAACSEGLAGFTGFSEPEHAATFTGTLPEPLQPGVNFCSDASKIGEVTVKSPLLPAGQFLKGSIYLATQNENPFGSLIALYLVANDPVSGVVFKAVGETQLTPSGQVIGVFKHNPQLAFEDAELHFFGGERAPLSSPAHCGPYTTNATFVPWSGTPTVNAASTFKITSGPNGTPCPGAALPFSPSLTGGMTNINAGAFSPLVTTIGRADGQQDMQSVVLHTPAGLEGLLTGVKLCPEAQANDGTCGPASLIGETTVSAGVGSSPVTVKGGRVYLTEKYAGAPFGLSIVNPVKAGPFDLEHDTSNPAQNPTCDCVVVRAKIDVDPTTAALTVTTDPSGPHAIPHLIDGIPVQIKAVNVTVNREHFTFNPTNCGPLSLTGTIASDEGASSPISVPFQATNCAVLKYTPKLTVSTAAKTSKANGASLSFKIAYPKGAVGTQSWFKYAKFELPKQLPARLTTLQKACLAQTFESNRSACPAASLIGHAVVHTPVLPVPLAGPVYFVSHGGAKFPDAVVVLQGYGITVELVGETFISKAGITSATFASTPDVPFESIEVTVPQGPFSEFGANLPAKAHGSFCGQKLTMPIVFKAQNGLELHQNTPVGVTGCGRTLTRAQKLAAALKACHKKHNKARRKACEKAARKAYGAKASRKHHKAHR